MNENPTLLYFFVLLNNIIQLIEKIGTNNFYKPDICQIYLLDISLLRVLLLLLSLVYSNSSVQILDFVLII